MSPATLAQLRSKLGPSLSVITPHGDNEPLALTWDETRAMCTDFGISLDLTTNLELLTAERLTEALPVTRTLLCSVDSHLPEVLATIRTGVQPARVFEHLRAAVTACDAYGVECRVLAVFTTLNGPTLPDTIDWLASIGVREVHILQLIDANGRSGRFDPLTQFSAPMVADIRARTVEAAERAQINLCWLAGAPSVHEHAPLRTARRSDDYEWHERLRNHLPGFCRFVLSGVKVDVHGQVRACCYAPEDELGLGSLHDDLEHVWNGPDARDLRRAMLTGDVPSACAGCQWQEPPPPVAWMPFMGHVEAQLDVAGCRPTIRAEGPDHAGRLRAPPVFELTIGESHGADRWFLALSPGGEVDGTEIWEVVAERSASGAHALHLPVEAWDRLPVNRAYWWACWAIGGDGGTRGSIALAVWFAMRTCRGSGGVACATPTVRPGSPMT